MGVYLLVKLFYKAKTVYKGQLAAVLIGISAPWAANAIYLAHMMPIRYLDPTPFAFTITGATFAWAFYYWRLLDIVPVAYERVVMGMGDPIFVIDAKGRIIETNRAGMDLLGLAQKDIIGIPMQTVFKDWHEMVAKLMDLQPMVAGDKLTGRTESERIGNVRFGKGDEKRHFEVAADSLLDRDGNYRGRIIVMRDVTSRVLAEEQLRKAHDGLEELVKIRTKDLNTERDLLNHIMDTSPVGIVMVERDGVISFANPQAEKVFGLTKKAITDRRYDSPDWKITSVDGGPWPDEAQPFTIVMRTGKSVHDIRHAIQHPNGKRVILSINASPVIDETGKAHGMVASVEDITKKVEDDGKLKESERNYRSIFEAVKDGLATIDPDTDRIVDVNPRWCEITGYPKEELKGHTVQEMFPPQMQVNYAFAHQTLQRIFQEGAIGFEWQMTTKAGKTVWLDVGMSRTSIGGKDMVLAIARDITDRKQAEKEKNELLMSKARAEVMGLLVSALPVFAASIPTEARGILVKNFGERFERIMRPRFQDDLKDLNLNMEIQRVEDIDIGMLFDVYLEWMIALFSSFGTQAKGRPGKDHGHIELLACPWIEAAKGNPIFCLICRTMVMRSFTWTGLEGSATQKQSIAGRAESCWFDFYILSSGQGGGKDLP
jgi:PAS domain S-box-containing protein